MLCLASLCIAIPQGAIFAQTDEQERLRRHHELEQQLQQQLQQQQLQQQQHRQTITWYVQVINATTFERLVYTREDVVRGANVPLEIFRSLEWVPFTAHGVSGLEEARWNIRRQLGFPADSDLRTAGGATQRIIWGNVLQQSAGMTTPRPAEIVPPAPIVFDPIVVDNGETTPRRREWWGRVLFIAAVAAVATVVAIGTAL